MKKLPSLRINKKNFTNVEDPYFKHSVGGGSIEEETKVQVKYDDTYLHIIFDCRNNPRMDQNYYTIDNSAIYNQEVFELFISKGPETPKEYIEIQLNPNDALYLSKITFYGRVDEHIDIELLDIPNSGIIHSVSKSETQNSWSGSLKIPLKLFSNHMEGRQHVYRFNIYRVILKEDQDHRDWVANSSNSIYSCWSSTFQEEPQFHVPERFGFLHME